MHHSSKSSGIQARESSACVQHKCANNLIVLFLAQYLKTLQTKNINKRKNKYNSSHLLHAIFVLFVVVVYKPLIITATLSELMENPVHLSSVAYSIFTCVTQTIHLISFSLFIPQIIFHSTKTHHRDLCRISVTDTACAVGFFPLVSFVRRLSTHSFPMKIKRLTQWKQISALETILD